MRILPRGMNLRVNSQVNCVASCAGQLRPFLEVSNMGMKIHDKPEKASGWVGLFNGVEAKQGYLRKMTVFMRFLDVPS